ncbi:response regulator transcription factor [Paenibacillus luteus]|uniref:response regulator transcription factor n=1 Tax=Paenibacillus luteus TaxID=2545753 RepID=UPI001141242B|nr:response regulator [Paenibacillus luteus]
MYSFIIVDDEPLIRKGLLKKIQSFGADLTFAGEADNGVDALDLIQKLDPDIIFTDMRMPEMDGKSLMKIVHQQYPNKKIIVISGHSDFDYMKEAISAKVISYLLKPFSREEIHRTLEQAIEAIELERSVKQEIVLKVAENEQISFHSDIQSLLHLIIGILQKDKLPSFQSARLKEACGAASHLLLTLYAPDAITQETIDSQQDYIYIPHSQSDKLAFILLSFPEESSEAAMLDHAKRTAEQLIRSVSVRRSSEGCVGISTVFHDFNALRQAHHETIAALDQRSLTDFGRCYVYNKHSLIPDVMLWERTHELLFLIESGQSAKVKELVLDFFAFYIRQPAVSLAQLKEQSRDMIQEVKKILSVYLHTHADGSPSSSLESVLNISFDLDSIREYLLTVLMSTADLLKDSSVYTSDNVIDNIKTYIHKNFTKDLTLEKISSLFYLNPSYLSFLFKEKTKQNFTDYINQLRIEQAKALLKNTDDKVYKVAKQLGYDNPKYFFRVFKKMTGLTPEEFRKS